MALKVKIPPEFNFKASKKEAFDALVEQRAREISKQYAEYAIDVMTLGIARIMVERHGWGTRGTASKIPQLFADFEELIAQIGDRYDDDCILTELHRWARENGVRYVERKI